MQEFEKLGVFYLGKNKSNNDLLLYDSKDLVTHAVCVGMTGSGKTGLCISLLEEAAIDSIPAIMIDPKGDLCNLLLQFPNLAPQDFAPWVEEGVDPAQQATLWKEGLAKWGEDGEGSGFEFAGTRSIFPTDVSEELVGKMQGIAVEAFNALRLRDYARIDLRVTDAGEIYVIEVNPNCYLERESEFARAAKQHGLEYDALVARIVDLAMARYAR